MNWQYYNPVIIHFGENSLNKLPAIVKEKKVLLVTTSGFTKRGITDRIIKILGRNRIFVFDRVSPNPSMININNAASEISKFSSGSIAALGGGSVIDTAKVLSILLSYPTKDISLRSILEGKNNLPDSSKLSIIAIPTTAGTGSEVTPFATIWDKTEKRKYSLTTPKIYPHTAILDPLLTLSLPRKETITSGLDALAHAFEAIWNRNATPITDIYATRALENIFISFPRMIKDMKNINYRAHMMKASLFAGLAISQTKTALSHSISYPLTAYLGMPHGLACSFTLPALLYFNTEEDEEYFLKIAKLLGSASVKKLQEELIRLYMYIGVDKLFNNYVTSLSDLLELAPQMISLKRAKNNIREAELEDIKNIVKESWKMIFC
ncbi:MAG: phosphonoacetaldehyde reductase [Atribacterota bacterium]